MIDKKYKNKSRTVFSIPMAVTILSVLVILFILGSIFDFNVSQFLYASDKELHGKIGSFISDFLLKSSAIVLESFWVAFAMSSIVLFKDRKLWLTIIINILMWGFVAIELGFDLSAIGTWEPLLGKTGSIAFNTLLVLGLTTGSILIGLFAFRNLDQKLVFKVIFWFMIITLVVTYFRFFLCYLASRPRPRIIFDASSPKDAFVPWWIWKPFDCFKHDKPFFYQSFPSGHSTETFFIVGYIAVLYRIKRIQSRKVAQILFGLGILVAALAPFGRLFGGWHYLSDVSFGVLLTNATFFGCSFLLNKRISLEKKYI